MLIVPTFLCASPIHGHGCFTAHDIPSGTLVWIYNGAVDRVLSPSPSHWERLHAYGSNARGGLLVLPGDNAAWINFSEVPNLIEAEEINGEFCLRSIRAIPAHTELTVFTDTDRDAEWKLKCTKADTNLLRVLPGRSAEIATSPSASSAPVAMSKKTAKN